MARFDQLARAHKLESFIDKVIDEVNNGNKPKELHLNKFFSAFCTPKGERKTKLRTDLISWYIARTGQLLFVISKKFEKLKSEFRG